MAEIAARSWYDETDQSGECDLTLGLVDLNGAVWEVDLVVGPAIVVTIARAGCVGVRSDP